MTAPRSVAADVASVPGPRLTLAEAVPPSLTRSSEQELLVRYAETRSPLLKAKVAEAFMPLARALAYRYRVGSEIDEGDLAQAANRGLLEAIDRFDPALGKPFRSHAVPIILGELRSHCRAHVWT